MFVLIAASIEIENVTINCLLGNLKEKTECIYGNLFKTLSENYVIEVQRMILSINNWSAKKNWLTVLIADINIMSLVLNDVFLIVMLSFFCWCEVVNMTCSKMG